MPLNTLGEAFFKVRPNTEGFAAELSRSVSDAGRSSSERFGRVFQRGAKAAAKNAGNEINQTLTRSVGVASTAAGNQLTKGFRRSLGRGLAGAGKAAATGVGIEFGRQFTGMVKNAAVKATQTFNRVFRDFGNQLEETGRGLIRRFGIPLGIAIAANVTQWQQLDAAIRETLTLFGEGSANVFQQRFDEMREGVAEVSRELGVLESNVTEGLYQAISAGIPRENVFEFLKVAQQAAIAGGIDLLTAVDGLTTAVNSFTAEGLTAEEAADVLFRTVARGKTTFDELSRDMARVAPLVASTGTSFAEFNAVVATMTLSGTRTAEAFTGIRAAITGLLRPSEAMNAIWEEAGFATGDLAIQTLGLQGAMQAVAEATNNEVSALISLLGGAEAANAVLQVTGDNQERFRSVLESTSDAAGAMGAAFEVMQEGTGRAFGQLTASLDQLGNAAGDLVDDFIVPLVRALTRGIRSMAQFVRRVGDFMEPFAAAFRQVVETLTNNRVFDVFVTSIGAAFVVVSALGTALGVVALGIAAFAKAVPLSLLALRPFSRLLPLLITGLGTISARFLSWGSILSSKTNPLLKILGERLTAAGTAMGAFVRAAGISTGVLGAVAVGIGAVVLGISALVKANKRWEEGVQDTTLQADLLADRLGLVTEEIGTLSTLDDISITSTFRFQAENFEILESLRNTVDEFGIEAGQAKLFQIAFRFVQRGNTPEDALEAIKEFANLGQLNIPIDFGTEDLNAQNFLNSVLVSFEDIESQIERLESGPFKRLDGPFIVFDRGARRARGELTKLADQTVALLTTAPPQGIEALNIINRQLEQIDPSAVQVFNEKVIQAVEELGDIDLQPNTILDFEEVRRVLSVILPEIEGQYADSFDRTQNEIRQFLAERDSLLSSPLPVTGFGAFTDEQKEVFNQLSDTMIESYGRATDFVNDRTSAIRTNFINQIPLIRGYSGAIKQTFTEWRKSQDAFQKDFAAWNERLKELTGKVPEELVERLEQLPLSERAWLASLKPEDFETALAELNESWSLVTDAADEEIKEELPAIVQEARAILSEEYAQLVEQAGRAGAEVAAEFRRRFQLGVLSWAPAFGAAANSAKNRLESEFEIQSPSRYMMRIADNLADAFAAQIRRREQAFTLNVGTNVSSPSFTPTTTAPTRTTGPLVGEINITNAEPQTDEISVEQAVSTAALLRSLWSSR